MKTAIILILSMLLFGCATPEQIAERREEIRQQQEDEAQSRIDAWTDRCEGYGQRRDTSAMASCIQSEAQAWQNRVQQADAINEANRQNSIRANLCAMGNREWCNTPQIRTVCNRDFRGALICNSQ